MTKKEDNNVSMITKSMELMEVLSQHPLGLTLQELVEKLAYPKSSIFKIANNLNDLGYIGREPKSLRYFISRKLLTLGLKAVSSYDIIEKSEEYMKLLRDAVGESVMIGALAGEEVVLIKQVPGSQDFVFVLKDGMRFNLYSTAPGKALFAFLSAEEQIAQLAKMELEALNEFTITDKKLLRKELEKIATKGYAMDLEETVTGVHCIAAPIFDEEGRAIACIWTSGPSGRLPKTMVEYVARKVEKAGLEISRNIGYNNNQSAVIS